MPAPSTTDEFIELIRKSGVAEATALDAAVASLRSRGETPSDPAKLAEYFVRDGVLTNFQAEQLLQGKWKRFTVGKYKVLERLGAGGMGQVFLCEHKVMRRRVAVKVLPAAKAADPTALKRFYREAQAVAALDHPNLVRAFDIDQEDHIHFLVMEYVDGTNLQNLVANRVRRTGTALSVAEACHYIHGAAQGLQHAHETGLVHRDVKPGNILVDRAGNVKVLDLGLARFFHDQTDQLTQKFDESTLGTADYIAPEQVSDSHWADIRADLYALGGTFYFLLTGHPPFHEGTVPQKLIWHQSRQPKPVTDYRPDVPAGVVSIVTRLMAKNPADRYQTPAELIAALAPWVRIPVPPPSEDEFPRLSPAATVQGSGRVGASAAIRPNAGSLGEPSLSEVPTAAMPSPVFDPAAVWTAVAEETRTEGDTGLPRSANAARRPAPTAPPDKRRIGIALGSGLAVILVAGLVYWGTRGGNGPATNPTGDAGPKGPARLYVTKGPAGVDRSPVYPTLAAALAQARPHDTIVLLDPTLNEGPIRLGGSGKHGIHDLAIVSETGTKLTVWTVSGSKSAEAAIELIDVANVSIRGLSIQVGGTLPVGISVVGSCPGLDLDHLSVTHAAKTGIRFVNAAGDPAAPIRLAHFRVVSPTPSESGITFRAVHPLSNKNLRLSWGRLEGPGKQAVLVDGPVDDVELATTRISNWDSGVTMGPGLVSDSTFRLALTSNTFYGLKSSGLRVDGDIPLDVRADVAFKRNFFAKMPEVIRFNNSKSYNIPGLTQEDNARDKTTRAGRITFTTFEVSDTDLKNTDPQSDRFLRYSRESQLATAGANGTPVGVPPD